MPDITKETIKYVAELAKLKFTDAELEPFTKQFGAILSYVETLNQLDTHDVPPTLHTLDISNVFRSDVESAMTTFREEILQNAPSKIDGYFHVPDIID